ncbi:DegQ family serine endoprotease [Oryzifoliimicrobium ureilyticus]|uniref:DegQ family serine endoprotease n=1 Tax=Oryzifoliimicrobium ureilyticus TaxID=3113724 RepID=UPI00307622A4
MSNIIKTHRKAAMLGAAFIIAASCAPFVYSGSQALAAGNEPGGVLAGSGSFASVVDMDKPAVVTITSTMKETAGGQQAPMDEEFRHFFEEQGIPVPKQSPKESGHAMALGSGFIISPDGLIVTNNHVIDKATDVKVTLDDGTELPGKVVAADPKSDLAVVRVKADKPLPTVAWGDSDKLKLGDQILAIGNPFGIGTTVTAGIVSARGRDLHSGPYDDFIQIDAPINHGNSGGPLVDRDGKVVGINTAIYSPNGGSVGVGFAIPSDQAQKIVARLETGKAIEHGYLGVQIQPVTSDVANAVGYSKTQGALVANVSDDTPAARAGLKSGDIIMRLGDQDVKTPHDLSRLVADLAPGAHENLDVWRDGKNVSLTVTVGDNDNDQQVASAQEDQGEAQKSASIGIGLANLTPDIREQLHLSGRTDGAVVASVNPDKPAADAGIQTGDVIVSVNDKHVHDASDVKKLVTDAAKSGKKSVLLLIERNGAKTFVAVPFERA